MPEGPDTAPIVGAKIGPLPVIAWVGIAAGGIALLIAWRSKQGKAGSNTAGSTQGGVGNPPISQTDFDTAMQGLNGNLQGVTQSLSDQQKAFQDLFNQQNSAIASAQQALSQAVNAGGQGQQDALQAAKQAIQDALTAATGQQQQGFANVADQIRQVQAQLTATSQAVQSGNTSQQQAQQQLQSLLATLQGIGSAAQQQYQQENAFYAQQRSFNTNLMAMLTNFRDTALAKLDFLAAQNQTYLPNIYDRIVMRGQ